MQNDNQAVFQTNLLNDVTFSKLFASEENLHITKAFLNDVMELDVAQVTSVSPVYSIEQLEDAKKDPDYEGAILELLIERNNGQKAAVVMQNIPDEDKKYYVERATYHTQKTLANVNDIYNFRAFRPVHGVNIVNFRDEARLPDSVNQFALLESKTRKEFEVAPGVISFDINFFCLQIDSDDPIIRHWQSLFLTGKVSSDAPKYLQEAAAIIASKNLNQEERRQYLDFVKP